MRRESRESWPVEALVAEIERLESDLDRALVLAGTDPLTGLANRRAIGQAVERALVNGPVGLLLVDLNKFKDINDTYGHEAGDLVLTVVADRLTHALVPGEVAARHGGDEFAVLVPDPTIAEARAERVREAITGPVTLPVTLPGHVTDQVTWSVRASVGHAIASTAEDLWRAADERMYQAKAMSRLADENTRLGVAA